MHLARQRATGAVRLFVSGILLFLIPYSASASVSITEVMYDAEGADTKHEWIEVWNDGAATDFSDWKLFEGGTNHKLSIFAGSATVPSGGYAVIADDATTFLADYPNFSGIVFDTALSGGLTNGSGETLVLRNTSAVDIDTLTYDPTLGAAGDGKSLQKVGSSWQASTPTPGASNGSAPESEPVIPPTEDSPAVNQSTVIEPSIGGSGPVPQIRAFAGDDRTVTAGASVVFSGLAVGLKGEPIPNARYVWSFGNGDTREGKSILYAYPYPGRYVVTLDASSELWSASDRIVITAIAAQVSVISATSEYIEIENSSGVELDIGLWQLSSLGKTFTFPQHTVILPKSKVRINVVATGLSVSRVQDVTLLYPNGVRAAGYTEPLFLPVSQGESAGFGGVASAYSGTQNEPEYERENLIAGAAMAAPVLALESTPYFVWVLLLGILILLGGAAAYFLYKP